MLNVYLSGEIHTNWREEIIQLCEKEKLKINFSSPTTNHDASDNCGVEILGHEEKNFLMHLIIVVLKYLVMRRKIFGRIIKGQRLILLKLKSL